MDRDDQHDPDAPPTAEELAEAKALREGLEGSAGAVPAADFARAIALAHDPRAIEASQHQAIVEQGIVRGEARRRAARGRRTRRALGIAGGLAMAAAIALAIGQGPLERSRDAPTASLVEPLVPVRSTQALFREPFARAGGESARIDRIASARAADLRDNRFSAWGVR